MALAPSNLAPRSDDPTVEVVATIAAVQEDAAVEAVNHMDVILSSAEVGPNWAAVSIAAEKMMELRPLRPLLWMRCQFYN